MPVAKDIHGVVFERGSATLLARIIGSDGEPIQILDVEAVEYTVSEIDECAHGASNPVLGHDQISLLPQHVLFDSPQTDAVWGVDDVGYNFRHELDVSTNAAFPSRGRLYHVRFDLIPYAGQRIVLRFALRAI